MRTVVQMAESQLMQLTTGELAELGRRIEIELEIDVPPEAIQRSYGPLSDYGQRVFMLHAMYEDHLEQVWEKRCEMPFDRLLAVHEFELETLLEYLSDEMSEELRQLGTDEFDGMNPIFINRGFEVVQYDGVCSAEEDDDDEGRYFLSFSDHLTPCDLPN